MKKINAKTRQLLEETAEADHAVGEGKIGAAIVMLLEWYDDMQKIPSQQRDALFLSSVVSELVRARKKFPSTPYCLAALMEEVGEVAQALLKHKAGKGDASAVYAECVQVAAMALRLAVEGDLSFSADLKYTEPS